MEEYKEKFRKDDYCLFCKKDEISIEKKDEKLKCYSGQEYAYLKYGDLVKVLYFNLDEESEIIKDTIIDDDNNQEEVRHLTFMNDLYCINPSPSTNELKIVGYENFPFEVFESSVARKDGKLVFPMSPMTEKLIAKIEEWLKRNK